MRRYGAYQQIPVSKMRERPISLVWHHRKKKNSKEFSSVYYIQTLINYIGKLYHKFVQEFRRMIEYTIK